MQEGKVRHRWRTWGVLSGRIDIGFESHPIYEKLGCYIVPLLCFILERAAAGTHYDEHTQETHQQPR